MHVTLNKLSNFVSAETFFFSEVFYKQVEFYLDDSLTYSLTRTAQATIEYNRIRIDIGLLYNGLCLLHLMLFYFILTIIESKYD